MQFQDFIEDEKLSPTLVANALRTTNAEMVSTLGLAKDALTRASQVGAKKTQVRLRQMLEVLNRVEDDTGSLLAAYAWFRGQPLPGFGSATPDQLLRKGKPAMSMPILSGSWQAAISEAVRSRCASKGFPTAVTIRSGPGRPCRAKERADTAAASTGGAFRHSTPRSTH